MPPARAGAARPCAMPDPIIRHGGSHGHDPPLWLHSNVGPDRERFLLFHQTAENFPPIVKIVAGWRVCGRRAPNPASGLLNIRSPHLRRRWGRRPPRQPLARRRVPDAVQRVALAERCTADPGPFQTQRPERSRVCSAPPRGAALRPGQAEQANARSPPAPCGIPPADRPRTAPAAAPPPRRRRGRCRARPSRLRRGNPCPSW